MIARMPNEFAPRSIADTRRMRAIVLRRLIRVAIRRIGRRIAALHERIALARQHRRDMEMLMQADHRMLTDIGLTRADVRAAAEGPWRRSGRMLAAAADRRREAMQAAQTRRQSLPRMQAPALTPNAAGRMVETANFR